MKLFDVRGTIKCGHRLYEVQKYIVDRTPVDAVTQYRKEHPNAKCLQVHYKYDVQSPVDPQILFTNLQKKGWQIANPML